MTFDKYLKEKQTFIFELDNVIYPEKDYFLQVYYLFAQFIAYGEQLNEAEVLNYMQDTYLEEGSEDVFTKTVAKFNLPQKYRVNFELLLHNIRLPLKLLVFNEVLSLLQQIVVERKQIFLFVPGDLVMQLNKIKQVEWNGMEKYLTVYFAEEFEQAADALGLILEKHLLKKEDVLLIGRSEFAKASAASVKICYLNADELFVK